ncbi:WhiB family transcriptional regulator [Plantibacter flavus]|uniref:WhiB family transcriptional regulator n=1 Tax=Plantibacter flavus TaxID=150123 RepID=UPI00197BEE5E|nr:WhiB family transcriptional regulator [Plantibacter flavus]
MTTGLFQDIVANLVPVMPERLERFDTPLTYTEIRAQARQVLLVWLRARLTKQPLSSHFTESLACSTESSRDWYFPEWPSANDYEEGAEAEDFKHAYALAEIAQASAKATCADCPLRVQCLALSIGADPSESAPPATEGVWGGLGELAREAVANRFNMSRRAYLNRLSVMADAPHKGGPLMDPSEVEALEEAALRGQSSVRQQTGSSLDFVSR